MSRGTYKKMVFWLLLVTILLVVLPPFHIRTLDSPGAGTSSDVASLAVGFWRSSLVTPQVPPTDLQLLVEALNGDSRNGSGSYGHRPGIGGPLFYYVSGTARVVTVDRRGIWLDTGGGGIHAVLQTGPIFGSALRDATGLLRLEDFNSFDFNELAARLNRLSETVAQADWRSAAQVGSMLHFIAAGRLNTANGDGRTLLLAPIQVQVK
jgi:hypothetical protein